VRVWDTEDNNGVLIYLLLADRDVEIVADRGVHAKVGDKGWEAICGKMEAEFRAGRFEAADGASWIKLTASENGAFSVTNGRTGWTKHYPAR